MLEKERRWKLKELPPAECISGNVDIEDVYTNSNDESYPSNRIRKMIGEEYTVYTHCTKYNLNDGVREEIEPEITENQYIRIFDFIGKIPIKKKRVFITLPTVNTGSGGIYQTATIDYFEDGDIIVEVEFYSEKEMNEFMIPYWFGEEIKDEKSYSFQKFYELNADSYWK